MEIPKNVLKRKIREYSPYLNMSCTVGELKKQLENLPDDLEIQADYGYYEGDNTSFYVTIKSEETDEDYNNRIESYVKRTEKLQNHRMVSQHIVDFVKNNDSVSLDDVLKSLDKFKGRKFGFRCSQVVNELLADGHIYFNDDRSKIHFANDLP
jgi:hypothetical protein